MQTMYLWQLKKCMYMMNEYSDDDSDTMLKLRVYTHVYTPMCVDVMKCVSFVLL